METKIQLNYISDMNAFVNACSTVFEEEIYVKQGRQKEEISLWMEDK